MVLSLPHKPHSGERRHHLLLGDVTVIVLVVHPGSKILFRLFSVTYRLRAEPVNMRYNTVTYLKASLISSSVSSPSATFCLNMFH